IRSPLDERTRNGDDHPARLFLRFVTDRREKRAMGVIWSNRLKAGTTNNAAFLTSLPMAVTTGSAAGSTRGSISPVSMPKSGKMRRRRRWPMSPCSATAMTPTPPASATSRMFGLNGGELGQLARADAGHTTQHDPGHYLMLLLKYQDSSISRIIRD